MTLQTRVQQSSKVQVQKTGWMQNAKLKIRVRKELFKMVLKSKSEISQNTHR